MTSIKNDKFTEIPLGLKGKVFRSVMPYGSYDDSWDTFENFNKENITVIVLLASDAECIEKSGKNLREFYESKMIKVVYFPIKDYTAPQENDLIEIVNIAWELADIGENIVIHCSAGMGRTGTFVTILAGKVLKMNGDDAINWVRKYFHAVETDEQIDIVKKILNK